MPVMKQFRIGSATYDTVGEASVTQVQTSGTKIATVTIDGTATDLYAPEGGGGSTVTVTQTLTSGTEIASVSVDGTATKLYAPTPPAVPSASSTTPSMDGTAAVGTATTYARADHVHPTDTSLVPKSATNGNKETTIANNGNRLMLTFEEGDSYSDVILGRNTGPSIYATDGTNSATVDVLPTGVSIDKLVTQTTSTMPTTKQYVDDGLAAKQATLVSGTNIKTVNSTSLLGSGNVEVQPTLVSGTNIKTINDESLLGSGNITIGGGGGGAGLVINAVVDSSGNVVSHDADTTTCLDFAQAAVNNSDASAVAYVRQYYYDDEDDYYSSSVYPLPLINASTNSYGVGQYDVSAGIRLVFGYARATIASSAKMYIHTRELEISTINDDPEMPVSITYTDKQASSNS